MRRATPRPAEVTVLAGMTAIATLACVLLYFVPISPNATSTTRASLAILSAILTTVLWTLPRVPVALLHVMVLMWLGGITVAVLSAANPQGAAGSAFSYTWMLFYTSYFFTERQARCYAAATAAVFLMACIAHPFPGAGAIWVTVTITCVAGCELLVRLLRQLRSAALQDALTGQRNRAALIAQGAQAIRTARRRQQPLTVAVLDLDHFKQINDERGHAAGDAVLQDITREWTQQLREGDTLYRSGGDEFVLLLPDTTAQAAAALLRRLQASSRTPWCFGLAEIRPDDDLDNALARADRRLYAAKTARPLPLPSPRAPITLPEHQPINP